MVMHGHLSWHCHSLIGVGLVVIWLLYVLFLILAIHRLQKTTRNIINAKI